MYLKALSLLILAGAGLAPALGHSPRPGSQGASVNQLSIGDPALVILQRDDVQADLALTDEELGKLSDVRIGLAAQMDDLQQPQPSGTLVEGAEPPVVAPQNIKDLLKKASDEAVRVLTDAQQRRLRQIAIQLLGNLSALDPDIQSTLNITDSQRERIQDLANLETEANHAVAEKADRGDLPPSQVSSIAQKNAKILGDEIGKVLTSIQKAKLKSLAGPVFKVTDLQKPWPA